MLLQGYELGQWGFKQQSVFGSREVFCNCMSNMQKARLIKKFRVQNDKRNVYYKMVLRGRFFVDKFIRPLMEIEEYGKDPTF